MAMKKKHEPALKARVAPEPIKSEKTLAQLSSEYRINANWSPNGKKSYFSAQPVFSRSPAIQFPSTMKT